MSSVALEKYKARSATSPSRRNRPATRRAAIAARAHAALLLRAETPRQPPALRLPARTQRRAAVVGGAEGAVTRSSDEAAGHARRGSPVRYGEFEGVIPSGYGAGIVMLWDRGTWTPEVDDVDAALEKGDLKFTLDGYKLKGSWVLVRTKGGYAGRGQEGSLVAAHQAPRRLVAGELDIAEFAPLSVKSEGDFADILSQDNPDIWRSNRPAQGGETGALFDRIIAQAMQMRAGTRDSESGDRARDPALERLGRRKRFRPRPSRPRLSRPGPSSRRPQRRPHGHSDRSVTVARPTAPAGSGEPARCDPAAASG